jgi:predicted ATPase
VALTWLGELISAREHFEQGVVEHVPQLPSSTLVDLGVVGLSYPAFALWALGYPDQAVKKSQEALTLAQERSHPFSVAFALHNVAILHMYRREEHLIQERTEPLLALATEQGFPDYVGAGTIWQGWLLILQGRLEEGMALMRQGLAAYRATGAGLLWPSILVPLAETYGKKGQPEEGLAVLEEALSVVNQTGERFYEAELYRLKGELTLQQFQVSSSKFEVSPSLQHLTPSTHTEAEVEAYFLKAIEIARKQQAKSLCLWQQQGKQKEAHALLSEVYNWFTEGFDTKDLQEAKALLEQLT